MKKITYIIIFLLVISTESIAQRINTEALGKEYFVNGEFEKAETIYQKLYQNDPTKIEYYSKYYQCLMAQKKTELSEKLVKKMLKRSNNYPTYYIDLGLV
jgi:tetratricopeptide (TPR) repeat protein